MATVLSHRKPDIKLAREHNQELESKHYKLKQDSIAQIFAVCGSFFQSAADEGLSNNVNPIRAIKKNLNTSNELLLPKARSLTALQWDFVLETAKIMASQDPQLHERTLFILATIYSMYLRVSDIVGRDN